ncbi:bifunctional riboflavin kinase/FAD synthetase [Alteromonas aestuariivivens]|uniref:Riboflavin biosynthesis protein n=1 Tax=Alteromonas aestuariivivens TaxID=1938339 RepID=A0A3D8MFP2_9ALTE|nr:bifunctional riboflavin kinase/FAD synthetase [Alteromonas aestuariivivens]RDV29440.1 bifunctional riboflavin kinase/FAD synthetase [Alteromonas aestuariivivens]
MELIRGLHNLREQHRGCVLTIGKFDGVHLGHQAVLANVIRQARALGLPATVMVFEPQPEEVFTPEQAPARISTLRDKYTLLKAQGVDRLLCVQFNRAFAAQSASRFIEDLLVARLGVKFLVVGDDFHFGRGRQGNFDMLEQAGAKYGFDVVSTQSFRMQDCRISSTEIRQALALGDFSKAQGMLGRPFSICGRVIHGDKKGRTIGFPTANVLLKRCQAPIKGVFAVRAEVQGQCFDGVANVGARPTVDGVRTQLEVHLFDYAGSLYSQLIDVRPVKKLREEQKFASFEELKHQIELDAHQARQVFEIVK